MSFDGIKSPYSRAEEISNKNNQNHTEIKIRRVEAVKKPMHQNGTPLRIGSARKPQIITTKTKPVAPRVRSVNRRWVFKKKLPQFPDWNFKALHINLWLPRQYVMPVVIVLITMAFAGGMAVALQTPKSVAEDQTPPTPAGTAGVLLTASSTGSVDLPNSKLYGMTLSELEVYFNDESAKSQKLSEQQKLKERADKIRSYLIGKNSPLADIADTLAGLQHWQMVLAISNSESSLGKHCYINNCSGIGVAPENPLWRNYDTTAQWAIDLDKLIDKRYKDWTLDQMNGVYVKPGSKNWVSAATQILEELQQAGIQ